MCNVSLLFSALYATCPYYVGLYMQRVSLLIRRWPAWGVPWADFDAFFKVVMHGTDIESKFTLQLYMCNIIL